MIVFVGHTTAGIMLAVLSGTWLFVTWNNFLQSRCFSKMQETRTRRKSNTRFRGQILIKLPHCPEFPLDGVYKLAATVVGIAYGIITVAYYKSPWVIHNAHHIAMYAFFGLSGAVDLMVGAGVPVPDGTDYAAFVLAFLIEGLTFYYHMPGKTPLDAHVHMLLIIAIATIVFMMFVEMKFKHESLPVLLRSMAVMVQGTWLIHIGFILSNPCPGNLPWDFQSQEAIMTVTVFYILHILGAVLVVFISGFLVFSWSRRKSTSNHDSGRYAPVPTNITDCSDSLKLASTENETS